MEDLSENFFENHRKSDRICVIVCVYLSLENNFLEVYHAYRTMENNGDRIADRKMIYAVFGLAASMLCIMGYYPVVPAFYTACCLDKKRNFLLYIGLVVGMGWCMPVAAIVKYLFILFVLGIAIRFYIWANRRCSGWTAGMIAGITTIAMNTSGLLILNMEKKALILGISEGVIVFALAVLFHYGIGMGSQIFRERHKNRVEEEGVETMVGMDPQGRIHAFAEAVDELPWHLPRWTAGKSQNSRTIWIFLPRRLPESCVRTAMDVSCV